jgi:hypothetical protein
MLRDSAKQVCLGVAAVVAGLAGLLVVISVLGQMMDVGARRSEAHDRCLKQATNRLEINHCN